MSGLFLRRQISGQLVLLTLVRTYRSWQLSPPSGRFIVMAMRSARSSDLDTLSAFRDERCTVGQVEIMSLLRIATFSTKLLATIPNCSRV